MYRKDNMNNRKNTGNVGDAASFEKRKKVLYSLICDDLYVPMKFKELAMLLNVSKEQRDELRSVLESLEEDGKIFLSKKGKYCKGEAKHLEGVYRASKSGFGFVIVSDEDRDVYIPAEETGGAFDGDTVEIVITRDGECGNGRRSREGKVTRIVERGFTKVVGLFRINPGKNYGFVIPDNPHFDQDVFVPAGQAKGAVDGHKVVAELTSYGEPGKKPEGKVVEILGHITDPGTDILSIVKAYDIPTEFPEKVMNQAERVAKPVTTADMAGRKDIRDWQMVTIDGEDAKDLDDAVSCTMEEENYILGVHIADVTNYVQENSALDHEALERGTSVYLVDRVIPMLPRTLSNGICSLNAGEDRLALSCIMKVNPKGEIIEHEIAETVIHVDQRMTYTSVNKIIKEKDPEESLKYKDLVPMFERMRELSQILRARRTKRGAIDFDFPESKMILDEQGHPIDIKPYDRNMATKLIEDFMLAANETVAEDYFWQELPFVYRVHETPDMEKMKKLSIFINNFGYSMHLGTSTEIKPKEIQKLLTKVHGKPEEAMISRLALRSMKQARYTPDNDGHFGLAAPYYTHFTSPIRRYPDLQIHRIIKDNLRGRMNENRIAHYESILQDVTKQASETERRAEEAERETIKLKKVEYMKERMYHVYRGTVSGVTKWGVYVELPNTIEGLVHVTNMRDDHYEYDESRYEMVGVHTGRSYRLGQQVIVRVIGADRLLRTIDFEFAREEELIDEESEIGWQTDCQQ